MSYIVSYQKNITSVITEVLIVHPDGDENVTELCTVGGITYVSIPDGVEIDMDIQPECVKDSIQNLEKAKTPEELKALISEHSFHVKLIDERVRERIALKYPLHEEIKILRLALNGDDGINDNGLNTYNAYNTY